MWGKGLLIGILLVLAACSEPSLRALPTENPETVNAEPGNLCDDVTCPNNQFCQNGECTCLDNQKLCNGECIQQDSCCSEADCDTGHCIDGACIDCPYGMSFQDGQCRCANDKKWCPEQNKCIDRDDCCIHQLCNAFERCVPTIWRTQLCFEQENKKTCRLLTDTGFDEVVAINGTEYRVKPANWWQDGSISFRINNQTVRVAENQRLEHDNIILYHESIEEFGGYCKIDEADDG